MTNTEYNKRLDALAESAMKTILAHKDVFLNNSHEFVADLAYDYAEKMLISRESYIKGNK